VEELETRTMLSASAGVPAGLAGLHARTSALAANAYNPGAPPYTPNEIRAAYGVNRIQFPNGSGGFVTGNGSGETIALVDAYYDPDIAADLATFDSTFGLPAPPSLTVLNQNGGTNLSGISTPPASSDWALEESIDVEWSHSIAPAANIVLFEAYSNANLDLDTADMSAANPATYAALGIPATTIVSDSWYSPEGPNPNTQETQADEQYEDANFYQPISSAGNVTVLTCTGDIGTQGYPATSPYVMAVGGTSLYMNSGPFGTSYGSETAWTIYSDPSNPTGYEGTGGGTSLYESEPTFQTAYGINNTGGMRATPDVSMDASSSTPFYFEDSYDFPGYTPLQLYCYGTSVATPMWAALVTITNQGRALEGKGVLANAQEAVYQIPESDFHDVTTGYNVVASAGPGYDEVTGIGTPIANKVVSDLVNATTGPVNVADAVISGNPSTVPSNLSGTGGAGSDSSTGSVSLTDSANVSAAFATMSGSGPVLRLLTAKAPSLAAATSSPGNAAVRGETAAVTALPGYGSEGSAGFHGAADALASADAVAAPVGADLPGGQADLPTAAAEQAINSLTSEPSAPQGTASDAVFADYRPAWATDPGISATPGVIEGEAYRTIDLATAAALVLALGGSWNTAIRTEEVRKYPAIRG
jgi:subtilase family serine protease